MSDGSKKSGMSGRSVVTIVLVVLLLIVILQNTADTKLHILFFNVTWPLWLLLAAFALVAFAAGWFARRARE